MPESLSNDAQNPGNDLEQERISLLQDAIQDNGTSSTQRTPSRRQPSVSQNGGPRTPRTTNRVRFDIQESSDTPAELAHTSDDEAEEWLEDDDYFSRGSRSNAAQRAPLLTGIEAPSVTAASEINLDDLLEDARPKSGISSAFMNMANSIIGAGIIGRNLLRNGTSAFSAQQKSIGQPYAFKQSGMITGIVLLVTLTVVVRNLKQRIYITSGLRSL